MRRPARSPSRLAIVTLAQHAAPRNTTIASLAHITVLAYGWRRAAIAFVAGAASVVTLAPFDIWPVGFLTFPFLVWLLDGAAGGRFGAIVTAGITGWWFGFGYFVAGLYWIGYAFLVDAPTFGWLLPVAVIGLPAFMAIYTAIGAMLAFGAFYAQMSFVAMLLFDDLLAANPVTVGLAVWRTGLSFLRPFVFWVAAAVSVGGFLWAILHIPNPYLAIGSWLVFWGLAFHASLAAMHELGLEYHRNARELDWFRESGRSPS